MRFAEITIVVELSEEINNAEGESDLMDDVVSSLLDNSEYVTAFRAIEVKDCTEQCEAE